MIAEVLYVCQLVVDISWCMLLVAEMVCLAAEVEMVCLLTGDRDLLARWIRGPSHQMSGSMSSSDLVSVS